MTLAEARELSDYTKPLMTRYVFRIKFDGDGRPYKYKARLVIRGDMALPGVHYDDVFAPTASYSSIRLLVSIAAGAGLDLYQADISQAFLQAKLPKPVYIYKPPMPHSSLYRGSRNDENRLVGRVTQSLYGLPSSPRNWYTEYSGYLLKLGFRQLTSDPCVFYKRFRGDVLFTSVFVDDALIVSSSPDMRAWFLRKLGERFPVNADETKTAEWLLGVKISKDPASGDITLSQEQAIIKLATACDLARDGSCSRVTSPMESRVCLPKLEEPTVDANTCMNGLSYRSVIGSLLFVALCVRPDIACPVSILARHANSPGPEHVKALQRVVSYLYCTRSLGITYRYQPTQDARNIPVAQQSAQFGGGKSTTADGAPNLSSFCDADFAGSYDYRSTTGYAIMMNGGPVLWLSKLQTLTAQSTTEAETIAASECVKDVLHVRLFLSELGFGHVVNEPTHIMEDNSAVTAFANSLKNRSSARHYAVKLRFLQEQQALGSVKFVQTPTNQQIGDILTKPLHPAQFITLRDQLLGLEPIEFFGRQHELGGGART